MASPISSFAEAVAIVRQYGIRYARAISIQDQESVTLEVALNRVLAESIQADRDQPPFRRSTRDGFACRAVDANRNLPLTLRGTIRAGHDNSDAAVFPGDAWEIMTGAPVPAGADAVFMVEHAEQIFLSDPKLGTVKQVRLLTPRSIEHGDNVVPQGAEARAGEILAGFGRRISPALVALAAQFGYRHLAVFRRPRVAILSSGDELVSIDATPGPNQIRNSNLPMLAALVVAAGGIPIPLPTVADNEAAIDDAIEEARSTSVAADLLLISGGISAGRFDLVEGALTRAGARFHFRQVAMQPGKPVVFGEIVRAAGAEIASLPFFALPGNPVSSAVTFQVFAKPMLTALSGISVSFACENDFGFAKLTGGWSGKAGLTRFLPARCERASKPSDPSQASFEQMYPSVQLLPWQGSGDIAAFSRCDCFAVIPPEAAEIADGAVIQIMNFWN